MKARFFKGESGQAVILMALAMVVLIGFTAVAVDVGMVAVQRGKLQNAIDAAALAAAQVLPDTAAATTAANDYVQLNGYSPTDISISFSELNYRVNVSGSKTVPHTFAQVLGINEAIVSDTASAKKEVIYGPFDYVLFSGSKTNTLAFRGMNHNINGSIHSNYKVNFNGNTMTITGRSEAVSGFEGINANVILSNPLPNSAIMEMPIYPDPPAMPALPSGMTVLSSSPGWAGSNYVIDKPTYYNGNLTIDCNGSIKITGNGCLIATGDITLGGSAYVVIDTSNPIAIMSTGGKVRIDRPAMTGAGSIWAQGDINTTGGLLPGSLPHSISTSNSVAMRSVGGNIEFSTSMKLSGSGGLFAYKNIVMRGGSMGVDSTSIPSYYAQTGYIDFQNTNSIKGLIYAPKSYIKFSGGSCSIRGSLIADYFDLGNTILAEPPTGGSGASTTKIFLVE